VADLQNIFPGGFSAAVSSTDLVDPVTSFQTFCESNGLQISDLVADGEIHRVPHTSSKKGSLDGWYLLHISGKIPVGVCGCWKEPTFEAKWVADIGRKMTWAEDLEHKKWVAEVKAKKEADRKAAQEKAADRAEEEIGSFTDASAEHPYLARKHIQPHGIKLDRAGRLVIPITNDSGEIISHQSIDADGNKRFLKGGAVDGGFYELRGSRQVIFVGEGFATCASIFEATGHTVFVAFNAGNLAKVAKSVRATFPGSRVVIAADNDQFTDGNPGLTKARDAAKMVHGEVVHPVFNDQEIQTGKPTDFNDLHTLRGLDAVKDRIESVAGPIREKMAFEFSRIDSLALTEIDWIVDDYIESDSLTQLFGDPGGGKSFVAIDIACCIATGRSWHGHEVRQGAVFYIAGEGHNGLARRFKAWQLGTGQTLVGAPIYKSHRAAQLYDATEAAIVAESIKALVAESGVSPSMIVIDTLARNMGGDENSTEDMNAFIQHLDTYLRQPYRCCVMVVHHSGAMDKERSRGSTALRGALDSEYRVQLDPGSKMIQLEAKKMKDAELPASKAFSITQVDLPLLDRFGEPVKGAFLTAVDISGFMEKVQKKEYLTKNQRVCLESLIKLQKSITKEGQEPEPVPIDMWRDSVKSNGVDRRRFAEVKDWALDKGKVLEVDGGYLVRPVRPDSSGSDKNGASG